MKRLQFASFLLVGTFALSGCIDDTESPLGPEAPTRTLANAQGTMRVNVLLNTDATPDILAELGAHGTVTEQIEQIHAVLMRADSRDLREIRGLDFVASAGPDAKRSAGPVNPVALTDFAQGLSTWNLDAVDVTAGPGFDRRTVAQDGSGVVVGVLDTGLLHNWREYFPDERIVEELSISFTGGGPFSAGNVAEQPNKWERDVSSHGTHVTSTIIGYDFGGTPVNGVAPRANIVVVKVLNQNGSGWSSMVAQGIVYMTNLKIEGPLAGSPLVLNMSLGGGSLDPVEKAAVDYAVTNGVIIVAAAGNAGEAGMHYPGAYEPVISAGSIGWGFCESKDPETCQGQWTTGPWWWQLDVAEPTNPDHFYVSAFSSREEPGQDLDVLAPGSWVVGPFQLDNGVAPNYFFLSGTSMATPHVAGIVALMAQQNAGLTAGAAEQTLEAAAIPMPPDSRQVLLISGSVGTFTWGDDATGHGIITATAALGGSGVSGLGSSRGKKRGDS